MPKYFPAYEKYAKIRDSKGLTDYRISVEADIPKSTFSDWSSSRSLPKVEKMKAIADVLGCTIEDLLSEKQEE